MKLCLFDTIINTHLLFEGWDKLEPTNLSSQVRKVSFFFVSLALPCLLCRSPWKAQLMNVLLLGRWAMGGQFFFFFFLSIFIFVCFCFSKGLNFFICYVVLIDASIIGGDARFELLVATRSLIVAIVTMRQRYLQYTCVICYLYFLFFSFNRLQIYIFFSYLGIFFLSLSFLLE